MNDNENRRSFVQKSGTIGAILATSTPPAVFAQGSPGDRLTVGVVGLRRGMSHVGSWMTKKNVEVGYVCEVDERRLGDGVKRVESRQKKRKVKGVTDMRRIFEDRDVNIISIATPNFWHAPAAIMAINAGKHVYVEKPGSHNCWEAQMLMKAAEKHKRKVQMGNQRRSMPHYREGIAKLKDGAIGKVLYTRNWYKGARGSIGKGKPAPVPDWLNWELWQGPTPERPYKDNLVHYNWHWHWHYGGGELANNGIHGLDVCRWGLGAKYPERVTCSGDRYHFDDDQESPDTAYATYHCGESAATWESSSCHPRRNEKLPFVSFYGTEGTMSFFGTEAVISDFKGTEKERIKGSSSQDPHFQNLADAIRDNKPLNADIRDAQVSSIWCHLGNIAYRTRSVLDIDTKTGKPQNNPEAMKLWKRDYRPGWEPTT
ncbi:MAG: dehydrogenase [Verrucomicrobiales bacterium]|nr:dehydrogenase [Verrucomicrobiales bacterium]|tara:strand:+ start:1250 stop:2533 length:1284 start_codon:yes stop_codon:yes gene_type:complete